VRSSDENLDFVPETLTLTLLMARVAAHHKNHAATANDLAVLTNAFNARADFHSGYWLDSAL
jgi:hypothetical protein